MPCSPRAFAMAELDPAERLRRLVEKSKVPLAVLEAHIFDRHTVEAAKAGLVEGGA